MVIAVSRITLPNDVDGTDIILRDGSVLRRSLHRAVGQPPVRRHDYAADGTAGGALSAGAGDDAPMTDTPAVSVRIAISRLDIGATAPRCWKRTGWSCRPTRGPDAAGADAHRAAGAGRDRSGGRDPDRPAGRSARRDYRRRYTTLTSCRRNGRGTGPPRCLADRLGRAEASLIRGIFEARTHAAARLTAETKV